MPEFDYQEGDIIRAGHGYKVLKQLGSGGMSGCYLGEHRTMYRRCAIKVLHSRLWNRPDLVEMFEYEGRTIARLGQPAPHEGIIEILDLGRTSDRGEMPYLVMPYLFGETLDSALKRVGPFSILSAIGMTTRLLLALQYAHERGVIHRDVKPHNIFLVQPQLRSVLPDASKASEIVVKLLDWGIMKLVSSVDDRGVFIGTPAWASPEQIAGDGVGTSSDLYSAGVVLFETLTGRRPFVSKRNDRESLLRARSAPAPRLGDVGSFPEELEGLVARMLAHDPGKRPADARSIVLELQAIADGIREREDHVTDKGLFTDLLHGEQGPQPITVGSIAAPTIEDGDVPRRIFEKVQAALMQQQQEQREGAATSAGSIAGFESTVAEGSPETPAPLSGGLQGVGRTVRVDADPLAVRRAAETNLPAPASVGEGPALSVRYATVPLPGSGKAPGRAALQTTLPLAHRPHGVHVPPGALAAPAGAGAPRVSGGARRRWLAGVAPKPTRADAFKLVFAGVSAAVLMLVALWVLGLWPTRASVSAARGEEDGAAESLAAAERAGAAGGAGEAAAPGDVAGAAGDAGGAGDVGAAAAPGDVGEAAAPGPGRAEAGAAAPAPERAEAAAPTVAPARAERAAPAEAGASAAAAAATKVAADGGSAARSAAPEAAAPARGPTAPSRSTGPARAGTSAASGRPSAGDSRDAGAPKRPDFFVGFE